MSDDAAAGRAPLRTEVDHVIGGANDVQIVLDDHNGISLIHELVQHVEELRDVLEMQTRCGLI